MRHKTHAIKTRPNNPLRFLQRKNSIRRYSANDLTCAARKTTFRTRKRFHNNQYTPKSKVQPHGSARTHFYVRFNNGNIAMHRPTIIFSSFSQNHNRSIKTNQNKTTSNNHNKHPTQSLNLSIKNNQKTNRQNKHDKPSHQSIVKLITTNNTHNHSIKNALKTKHYNKHNNPSRHTPRFLNIKIIAD